ncbi:hypothetical protein TPHA_0C01430 [Tetrapisispora phaffii CBS 4417]|uniref:Ubiquitin-like protease family profile domain-containing protein n=1 Tax=Tetrapisispora phaffii (strain ATCC 24235 / CBS 4417 / NBRC 1672 / NRRL Y-8282 / UCD 70-5) TaxID=1071381 RepID=G8BRC3_TETPH|nr:hypothetical protein TPHA_0C01430 [Tetrapisispora phaffii CBS 4417]CCE62299.1 hypothetical protein TPHA_0C01430 [Tetrapisispora phaffii CBS 4417]
MSRRLTKINSIAPIDNLTTTNKTLHRVKKNNYQQPAHTSSKRYQDFRNDAKKKIRSSRDFIPDVVNIKNKNSLSRDELIDKKSQNGIKQRVEVSGSIELIEGKTNKILSDPFSKSCVMSFIYDDNGLRCDFKFKQLPIAGLQFNIKDDCDEIATEDTNVYMGFRFTHLKEVKIGKNESINMKGLIFITTAIYRQKLIKIRRLAASCPAQYRPKICMYSNKTELKFKLISNNRTDHMKNKPSFLEKGFNSLVKNTNTKKRTIDSMVTSAVKIKILKKAPEEEVKNIAIENAEPNNQVQSLLGNSKRVSRSSLQSTVVNEKETISDEVQINFQPSLNYHFKDGVSYTINNQDFKSLYNNDWVNDTIIDFFIKYYLETNLIDSKLKDDIYVMSSFFYTKLVSNGIDDVYTKVKKWVEHSKLFSKSYVIIPINSNYHWFVCIITGMVEYLKYWENKSTIENEDKKSNPPIIQIGLLDSLKQVHNKDIEYIKQFIMAYAKDKYSLNIDKNNIKKKTCLVPRQPNMNDCGVHLIDNIKKFSEKPDETIELWSRLKADNSYNLKQVNDFFDKSERKYSRQTLRKILIELQKEQIKSTPKNTPRRTEDEDDEDIEIIENFEEPDKQSLNKVKL